jgi:hypothetical protein
LLVKGQAMTPPRKPQIDDPNHVSETFVTSVVDVALISGSSIAVTLGMRRYTRGSFGTEPQEVVVVNDRLVLTLDAAQNLVEAVSMMLSRAKEANAPAGKPSLS